MSYTISFYQFLEKPPFFGFEMPFGTFYQSAFCIALSYPDNMVVITNQAIVWSMKGVKYVYMRVKISLSTV